MMGSGLLAEMKAKQERRAHKVGRANFYCVTSVQDPQVKAAQQGAPTHVHVQLSADWSMQLSAFGHKNTKKRGGSREMEGSRKDTRVVMGKCSKCRYWHTIISGD